MGTLPTKRVKRKADGVECIINETDFDPKLHEALKVSKTETISDPTPDRPALSDFNSNDAIELISKAETLEELLAFEKEEVEGKSRKGVLEAIEALKADLEE